MYPDLVPVWEAFVLLSPSRNMGWGAGAIPLTEVRAYCEMFEIEPEEREDLLYLLRALDEEYLKSTNEKGKQKRTGK
ncbi:MAG TPA: hypothetical protein VN493_01405 [Thermoanaerobaculia bacterium]|nr:hypothetical protein [Thermoanaerobaculia bacterium]